MQVTISVLAGSSQEGGRVVGRAIEGLRGSYAVEFLNDERSINRDGSTVTLTYDVTPLKAETRNEGQTVSKLKIEIDTSEVDAALEKVEALGKAFWEPQLSSGTVSVEAVQGLTTGYTVDPLESAIELIVRMMDERMASDRSPSLNVGVMLMGHLEELLAEQLRRVTDPDRDATLVSHLNEMTRKLQSLIDVKASTVP